MPKFYVIFSPQKNIFPDFPLGQMPTAPPSRMPVVPELTNADWKN